MRRVAGVAVAAVAVVSLFAPGGTASAGALRVAAAKPSATLSFAQAKIKAGTAPVVLYTTADLPSGALIYLQRQFGSSHTWKNILHLAAPAGKVTAPAVKIGRYQYRIHVTKNSKAVVNSTPRYLYAYGTVAYITLCSESENVGDLFCQEGTVQIGSMAFNYVESENAGYSYPDWYHMDILGSTSCDHITLTFGTTDTVSGDNAYAQVVQSHVRPVTNSAPIDTLGMLKAKLNGGALIVNVTETNGSAIYLNGSATCYTSNGLPPPKN